MKDRESPELGSNFGAFASTLRPGDRPGFVWEALDGLRFTFGPFNFQQAPAVHVGAAFAGLGVARLSRGLAPKSC